MASWTVVIRKLDGLQCIWGHTARCSMRAFPTGVLERWHNCLLIYWRTSCLVPAFDDTRAGDWVMPAFICRVTYFQFPIQSAFLLCGKPGSCSGVRGLPNIGHRTLPKMWEVRFLYAAYIPGEILWIDSNCKMDTRIMATWSRKTWKFVE